MTNILIVDDDVVKIEQVSAWTAAMLPPGAEAQIRAVLCRSVKEVIREIQSWRPSVLLLDFRYSQEPRDPTGAYVAEWIDRRYDGQIRVACISRNSADELRPHFEGCTCVHALVGIEDRDGAQRLKEFIEGSFPATERSPVR